MKLILFLFFCIAITYIPHIFARSSSGKDVLVPSKCVYGVSKSKLAYEEDINSWKTCPWQRFDVINMTGLGFDLNGDQLIEPYEIEFAKHYYFSPIELIFGESTKEVMDHCDCDGDGYISQDDFLNSDMSCIRNCDKAREVWWFLGSRIANGKPYSGVAIPDAKDRPAALDHLYQ